MGLATQLKSLSFGVDNYNRNIWPIAWDVNNVDDGLDFSVSWAVVSAGIQFSKLRSLSLYNVRCKQENLNSFLLDHAQSLRRLDLDDIRLPRNINNWPATFTLLKHRMDLDKLVLKGRWKIGSDPVVMDTVFLGRLKSCDRVVSYDGTIGCNLRNSIVDKAAAREVSGIWVEPCTSIVSRKGLGR